MPSAASPGSSAPDRATDRLLWDDIRRLGEQLGETLVRQEGREFLELVEEVRRAAKVVRRVGRLGCDAGGPVLSRG